MAVYLLHLDRPLSDGKARHYIGWAASEENARRLLRRHQRGKAYSRFTYHAALQGIDMALVSLWPSASKGFERRLKDEKNAWRHCPICRAARGFPPLKPRRDMCRLSFPHGESSQQERQQRSASVAA